MAASDGQTRVRLTVTVILALIFSVMPLPAAIDVARPELLLLLVIYWSLSAPHIAGLLFAWFCGLAIDLLKGTTLGQHALAFVLVAFIVHKNRLRMRVFPIWQQTLTMLLVIAVFYELPLWWLDGIIGQPVTTWTRWLPVLTSAMLWPVVVAILDTWNRRNR
jgi:rod shape-determining protein MreD